MICDDDQELPLSRTKKKAQAKQIELLAEQLAEMSDQQFARLEVPPRIIAEAEQARATRGRGSYRRQVKYLAGVLRKDDESLALLSAQIESMDQVAGGEKRQFHQLEQLRDQLCQAETFSAAFDRLVELAPQIDRKAISRLARSVQQHADKRAYREIFRRLRDELGGS